MRCKDIGTLRTKSMFFIIFTAFFCLWVQPFMTNAKSTETVDRIVAVVNDDVITLNELNKALKPYIQQIRTLGYLPEKEKQMIFKVRKSVLDRLIDEKIEDQEIKREKIEISDHQIDEAIERVKETHYYTDEDLRAGLASQDITMKEYRRQIKDQLARARLISQNVKSKIVITKEDIKAYYEKHIDQYGGKEKYHLRNIIMRVPEISDSDGRLEIREKMEGILQKLKAGQSFEALAKKYSQSPAASDGGDLGLFEFDSLSPKLQQAIKKIKPGGFTPVLDTDQGFQIFYLQKIVKTAGKPLKDVSSEIENIIYNKLIDEKYSEWIQSMRQQAVIRTIQ
ncbi:MAG: SurA N-terminal domain-containing protein [Desulfobacterales bacterium]|nr:SurA N-terminal domain-containing protein [Desulfobacterales bacterium]